MRWTLTILMTILSQRVDPNQNIESTGEFLAGSLSSKKDYMGLLNLTEAVKSRSSILHFVNNGATVDNIAHVEKTLTSVDIVRNKRLGCTEKYRSFDGSCNNGEHPEWGRSNMAFLRLLPPRYSDGILALPKSFYNNELPNARKISKLFFSGYNVGDYNLTLAVVQWGQLLAHDFARHMMDQTETGESIECCQTNGEKLPEFLRHHSCLPIEIPETDEFFSKFQRRCMNFVRSIGICEQNCEKKGTRQVNSVSSYLDLSPIYGNSRGENRGLRELLGGRMRTEIREERWMMPVSSEKSQFCDATSQEDICYVSGDPRTNQNPQLVILQTILVREHNRVANALSALNSHWDDERVFQESRRIVIAQYQHITYQRWLPLVIGESYAKQHGLLKKEKYLSDDYDASVNPSTIVDFTSGAFRFLHSIIEGNISTYSPTREPLDNFRLSDHYFRPKVVELGENFEGFLRGLVTQPMMRCGPFYHEEISEYLFRSTNEYGVDLAAIDIQRGRDHGLPGYNAYRKICEVEAAENFDDLIREIPEKDIRKLQSIYEHVNDIDLLVGVSFERRVEDGIIGPTARCLIAEQFYRTRKGDKFFYDLSNVPKPFTNGQFQELAKTSLARIICEVGGDVWKMQSNAFKQISQENSLMDCKEIPRIDLSLWKE